MESKFIVFRSNIFFSFYWLKNVRVKNVYEKIHVKKNDTLQIFNRCFVSIDRLLQFLIFKISIIFNFLLQFNDFLKKFAYFFTKFLYVATNKKLIVIEQLILEKYVSVRVAI